MSLTFLSLTHCSTSLPKVVIPVTGDLSKSLAKAQVLVLGVLHLLVQKPATGIMNGLGKGDGSYIFLKPFTSQKRTSKEYIYISLFGSHLCKYLVRN